MTNRATCPICLHETTMRARREGYEPCYDEPPVMHWCKPYGGARGQVCTKWDQGWWCCEFCEIKLTSVEAFILLDATLMCAFPDCDSITADGFHADSLVALEGGPL